MLCNQKIVQCHCKKNKKRKIQGIVKYKYNGKILRPGYESHGQTRIRGAEEGGYQGDGVWDGHKEGKQDCLQKSEIGECNDPE